jgi:hypothetical protein
MLVWRGVLSFGAKEETAMTLTGEQLTWLFLGQLAFGSVLVIAVAITVKGHLPQLLNQQNGKLALQIITIFFTCTITGNLTLMKILEPAATAALFGAVLGYVFGAGLLSRSKRQSKPDNNKAERFESK